jgi:hypothetical protein
MYYNEKSNIKKQRANMFSGGCDEFLSNSALQTIDVLIIFLFSMRSTE